MHHKQDERYIPVRERRCILAVPCLVESAGDGLTARWAAAAAAVEEVLAGTALPFAVVVLLGSIAGARAATVIFDGIVDEKAAIEEGLFATEVGNADISGTEISKRKGRMLFKREFSLSFFREDTDR